MEKQKKQYKKVVLAYSGGLDTSIIIPWLKENYGCEVVAAAGDVGQGTELDGLEAKALATGASKLYVMDLVDEFVEDYIIPTVQAGAKYEGTYLLGTSFARPPIAKKLVEIAKRKARTLSATDARARATTKCALNWLSTLWLPISGSSRPGVNGILCPVPP